jgi:pyruvate formate lyase activating enzyme
MVVIKGWQKTSLIDFSPNVASVVFLAGCTFKCGYCHNPELVMHYSEVPDIDEKEVLDYLDKKKMWVDGVCITGGEPTIYTDLPEFISKIKEKGLMVKLDTNGTNPEMISKVMKDVDYFAMDIKSHLDGYKDVVCTDVEHDKIKKSIVLIKNSGTDYEFRTTVIPNLVGKKEIFKISKWLKGSKRFVIQNFKGRKPLINNQLRDIGSYSKEELEEMKRIASEYFENVEVRD